MSLRIEITKDITGTNYILVIGNTRKMLSNNELSQIKKISNSKDIDNAGKSLYSFFSKERMDIIKEAELNDVKRKKPICEAIIKILQQYF